MGRRFLATALACLLAGIPLPGQTTALGVLLQSTGGHIGTALASAGATIYDGDRLSTEAMGALSLRAGTVQLSLSENANLVMHRDSDAGGWLRIVQRGRRGIAGERCRRACSASIVRADDWPNDT
jgi:hypothetical protein